MQRAQNSEFTSCMENGWWREDEKFITGPVSTTKPTTTTINHSQGCWTVCIIFELFLSRKRSAALHGETVFFYPNCSNNLVDQLIAYIVIHNHNAEKENCFVLLKLVEFICRFCSYSYLAFDVDFVVILSDIIWSPNPQDMWEDAPIRSFLKNYVSFLIPPC